MFNKYRLSRIVGICFAVIISALVLGSLALAQGGVQGPGVNGGGQATPSSFEPVPGGPGFISLSGVAFQPYLTDYSYSREGQSIYCLSVNCSFIASVAIPQKATVTKFVAYYYDNYADDLSATLFYAPLPNELVGVMAVVNSTGSSTQFRYSETTDISSATVDNQSNTYFIEVLIPGNSEIRLAGVRIDYSYPNNLPLIQK